MAFILQNSSAGVNALGGSGSALGYGTDGIVPAISSSAAVEFNLFAPYVQGTAFETDGATAAAAAAYNPTGGVAFWNGDAMHVVLSYNGSVLTETLTDLTNGATYSTSYAVDLAADVGAGTAYVGFSAATGAVYSTQTVSNFTFADLTVTIDPVDGNNVITLAEAQAAAGVPLSGTVTGLAANSTFQVTVTDNEVTKSYTATVNAAGTAWTATIPSSDATALANGTATVSAQVTDANGNQSLLATQLVTVDETPTTSFTDVWTNALGGSWTTPANWSTGVPGAADVISLPLSSGETVTVSSGTNSVSQIVETGAGGALAITSGSLSVSAQSDLAGSLLIERWRPRPRGAPGCACTDAIGRHAERERHADGGGSGDVDGQRQRRERDRHDPGGGRGLDYRQQQPQHDAVAHAGATGHQHGDRGQWRVDWARHDRHLEARQRCNIQRRKRHLRQWRDRADDQRIDLTPAR